jgi:lysophospholipase L1-like esterase
MASPHRRRFLFTLAGGTAALSAGAAAWWWITNRMTFGPTSGRVPVPGEVPNWMARHAKFVAQSREGKAEVVCLGDSITWGWDDHRDVWTERVTPRPTECYAIGGDTTGHLLWRLDDGELTGPPPKLVVLMIGTNNLWVNRDPADIADSIGDVVGRVRRNAASAKVLLLGIPPQGHAADSPNRRSFADVNRLLPKFADETVTVADVSGAVLEPDGRLSEATSTDGTHFTRRGYERLADAIGPTVRSLL